MKSFEMLRIFYLIVTCTGFILVGLTTFYKEMNYLLPAACLVILYGLIQNNHYHLLQKLEPELKIPEKEEKKP